MKRHGWVLALALVACGGPIATSTDGAPDRPSPAAPPALVRAKCGACHRLPSPNPARDNAKVLADHARRAPLDDGQAEAVLFYLQGPR